VLEVRDLRAHYAGKLTFVDFRLMVPGDIAVSSAHDICYRIEWAL
jgi:divalent metal cation (Fe/Co/Zn/Cd) transporter